MGDNGDPETEKRQTRAGSRSPSERDATVPAAIPARETQKAGTQQGAHGLPVSAACPTVSTSADSGLLRATGHAPSDVIHARPARSRPVRPLGEELSWAARAGGICAGADRDDANSLA